MLLYSFIGCCAALYWKNIIIFKEKKAIDLIYNAVHSGHEYDELKGKMIEYFVEDEKYELAEMIKLDLLYFIKEVKNAGDCKIHIIHRSTNAEVYCKELKNKPRQ